MALDIGGYQVLPHTKVSVSMLPKAYGVRALVFRPHPERVYWFIRLARLLLRAGFLRPLGTAGAPHDESVTAIFLELCLAGNVRTMTINADDREEMPGTLRKGG